MLKSDESYNPWYSDLHLSDVQPWCGRGLQLVPSRHKVLRDGGQGGGRGGASPSPRLAVKWGAGLGEVTRPRSAAGQVCGGRGRERVNRYGSGQRCSVTKHHLLEDGQQMNALSSSPLLIKPEDREKSKPNERPVAETNSGAQIGPWRASALAKTALGSMAGKMWWLRGLRPLGSFQPMCTVSLSIGTLSSGTSSSGSPELTEGHGKR